MPGLPGLLVCCRLFQLIGASSSHREHYREHVEVTALTSGSWRIDASQHHTLPARADATLAAALLRRLPDDAAGCGLAALDVAVAAGAWERAQAAPSGGTLPAPPGVTLRAVFRTSPRCASRPGVHLPATRAWAALLRALSGSVTLGGLPLSTGLQAVDDDEALADVPGGDARHWYTHRESRRSQGADAGDDGEEESFTLQLPATPGLGTGGGLPWARLAAGLITDASPCGATAGVASVFTPRLVAALAARGAQHGGARAHHQALRLQWRSSRSSGRAAEAVVTFTAVVRAAEEDRVVSVRGGSSSSIGGGDGGSGSGRDPFSGMPPHATGSNSSDSVNTLSLSSLLGWGAGQQVDECSVRPPPESSPGSGSTQARFHSLLLLRGVPGAIPPWNESRTWTLRELPAARLPRGVFPVARLGSTAASLTWAGRHVTQRHLGHGVVVSSVRVRLAASRGGSASAPPATGSAAHRDGPEESVLLRLLFLTPMPWFIASGLGGEAATTQRLAGNASGSAAPLVRYASVAMGGNADDASGSAPLASVAEAWALALDAGASRGHTLASLAAASRVANRGPLHAPEGPLLHVAVVDVRVTGAPRQDHAAPAEGADDVAIALSVPYTFPGLLHGDVQCPPDIHRGLDIPAAAVLLATLSSSEQHSSPLPAWAWQQPGVSVATALQRVAACFAGDAHALASGDCPPHPWDPAVSSSAALQLAHLPPVTVEPPCPDLSMPYNVVVLVCTAAAFVLGTTINTTARKLRPRRGAAPRCCACARCHRDGLCRRALPVRQAALPAVCAAGG